MVQDLTNQHPTERLARATVGIITALKKEHDAVLAAFGCDPEPVFAPRLASGRKYHLADVPTLNRGSITVAVGTLVRMGNNAAASRATDMRHDCRGIRNIIMTGIAGAVPNARKVEDHVRLGDLVISDLSGVVQYDFQKETDAGVENRSASFPPASELLEAVRDVPTGSDDARLAWEKQIVAVSKALGPGWGRPDLAEDRFEDTFLAPDGWRPAVAAWLAKGGRAAAAFLRSVFGGGTPTGAAADGARGHPFDPRRVPGQPRVFHGRIASGNNLLKKASRRDELRETFGVKAVEMEGAGIAEATWAGGIGYLVVRGTCDYCDRNKNDVWQNYAAVIAAVYTRQIIVQLDGTPPAAAPPPTATPPDPAAAPPTAVIYATGGSVVQNFQGNQIGHLTIGQPGQPTQVIEQIAESVRQWPDRVDERFGALERRFQELAQGVIAAQGPSDADVALYCQRTTELVAQMGRARDVYELAEVTRLADEAERWLLDRQAHLPSDLRKRAWWEVIACETFRQDARVNAGKEWDQSRIDRLLKEHDHA